MLVNLVEVVGPDFDLQLFLRNAHFSARNLPFKINFTRSPHLFVSMVHLDRDIMQEETGDLVFEYLLPHQACRAISGHESPLYEELDVQMQQLKIAHQDPRWLEYQESPWRVIIAKDAELK